MLFCLILYIRSSRACWHLSAVLHHWPHATALACWHSSYRRLSAAVLLASALLLVSAPAALLVSAPAA
eukprot:scaffold254670_cov23-Tisochrysis_lutea.AAC.1